MPTLILTPRQTPDAQALWRAAHRLGWNVRRLATWRVPEELLGVEEPVLYLEALFAPVLAEQLGLRLLEPPVDWLPRLPEEHRKRCIELTLLGEARKRQEPAFIKPPNDKSFPAGVYTGADLPPEFEDEMPVLVAEMLQWEKEFRCFILDREPRTLSIYLRDGELQSENDFAAPPEEEVEALEFVRSVLADPRVDLPRATVLDVGVIAGRGWAVVEQNAAWGAGLYGCDPEAVLHVLRHTTAPVAQIT
jgi:hypothetical protein